MTLGTSASHREPPLHQSAAIPRLYSNFAVLCGQVGAYEKDPTALALKLQSWLTDVDGEFAAMRKRAAELGRHFSRGLFRIVKDLAALAEESGHGCAPAFMKYAKQ